MPLSTVVGGEHHVFGLSVRLSVKTTGAVLGQQSPSSEVRTTATTNMAAANFVVITNGEGCALTGTADIDQ